MKCPNCNSENVLVQREQTGQIGGAHTYGKKRHGLIYWLFFGWWIWIFKMVFLPLTMLCGKRSKGLNTITGQKTFNRTVAVCQNCGNHWEIR